MEIILFCSELDNICEYKKVFHVVSLEGTLTVPLTLAQSEMVTSTITLLSIINTRNIKPSNHSNLQTIQTFRNIASMAF